MHNSSAPSPRYAIYFSPAEDTPLLRLGNEWLGRDPATDTSLTPNLPDEIAESEWSRVTETAARYGFHATLKPPFQLADGVTLSDLRQALMAFVERQSAIVVPPLTVGIVGSFLALTLSQESSVFSDLAADCVREFDLFRAPASELEITKRMHGSLTERERENLLRWGYPYVLDTWKFHMTLTCSLEKNSLELFRKHLSLRFAEVCKASLRIDAISLFEEPGLGMPFRMLERLGFNR
jgi:putative phosphonate metabolism protein